ncbi:S1C family serine protease [Paraliobacillus sp. X-1268]|uniref:S1C family serine protease n=1 Tax=Paraliobacillus sp. X-1268 TaxID=2213193 RepID=UPI000E3D0936|nr:trypsin-like peptidase domain-containing protein [Paraliobacillus sp. X-1268]
MVYYHDDEKEMNEQDQRTTEKKRNRWVLPGIIGLLLGMFLFAVALPGLVRYDILPYQIVISEDQLTVNNGETADLNNNLQSLSLDVTTQITGIVADVSPAVVGIENIQSEATFWDQESSEAGTGSGVIYKKADNRAFVVTNHHVIEGADQIEVILSDGTRLAAELKGTDLFTDLAVLEMDGEAVNHVIEIGNSDEVKVGEPAIAIGNPLGLNLSGSVTQGVISGKQRAIPQDFDGDGRADWQTEVIQTDAAINPGNSGGALLNVNGHLIGINSMKIAQSAVEGIGFAIPIDAAVPVINELETEGQMRRAFLGVEAYSLGDVAQVEWQRSLNLPNDVESGIYLQRIEPMSPASEADLEPYDVITALDDQEIGNIIDLRKHLYQVKEPGDEMVVTYYRGKEKNQVTIKLTEQE